MNETSAEDAISEGTSYPVMLDPVVTTIAAVLALSCRGAVRNPSKRF